jgi:hypothetical protein
LCPEADLRTEIYNTYFNSAEYTLVENKYQVAEKDSDRTFIRSSTNNSQYYLGDLVSVGNLTTNFMINTGLLLIEPGTELTRNNEYNFSSKAGDAVISYKVEDVLYGDYSNPLTSIDNLDSFNYLNSKIRGVFNTYIGTDYNNIKQATYYNIYQKGYNFDLY